jgi:hypothetical protein
MTERITPDGMKADPVIEEAAAVQTARFKNVHQDHCPICLTSFRQSEANGIPVMVCDSHAIVMPKKDD